METKVLIIGQGICGTWLSWFLEEQGCSYMVIDDGNHTSASRISTGIINPVSGRLREPAWMIDDVMPFAEEMYTAAGRRFNTSFIAQTPLADFFPTPQMRLSFNEQVNGHKYLHRSANEYDLDEYIHHAFGYGLTRPCYVVQMGKWVAHWRKYLSGSQRLIEKRFEGNGTNIIQAAKEQFGITAEKVIFCDGAASAQSRLFGLLPFALNKGEALTVRIPGLPQDHIYKRTLSLSPAGDDHFYWGSSYVWNTNDANPTKEFRERAEIQLRQFVKLPFITEDHRAAFRPATVERRPFAGFHPLYPQVGILNGMGSKGASLAPWLAKKTATFICNNQPVPAVIDIERFKRVLSK